MRSPLPVPAGVDEYPFASRVQIAESAALDGAPGMTRRDALHSASDA